MFSNLFRPSKLATLREATRRDPQDRKSLEGLADALEEKAGAAFPPAAPGGVLSAADRAALNEYLEAAALRHQVAQRHPADKPALKSFATVNEKIGAFLELGGLKERALESYDVMFAVYEAMIAANPDDIHTRLLLASRLSSLGTRFDPATAKKSLLRASALFEALVAEGRMPRELLDMYESVQARLAQMSPEPRSPRPSTSVAQGLRTAEGHEVPVTVFDGAVKQHSILEVPSLLRLFDMAFPGFRALPAGGTQGPQPEAGSWALTDMSGKLRRYCGGPSLPRGRYYGVCRPDGNDGGCVAREIFAYAEPGKTGIVLIDDMFDVAGVAAINKRYGAQFESGNYFLLYLDKPELFAGAPAEAAAYALSDPPVFFQVPYHTVRLRIENVLDLRLHHVQQWFYDIFSRPDVTNLGVPLPPTASFAEFLPLLLGQFRGGNLLTTAIGRELRRWGVNALVYPSARSDCGVKYQDGALADWYGWCMVVYQGLPREVEGAVFDELVSVNIMQDRTLLRDGWAFYGVALEDVALNYLDEGRERGSWQVSGQDALNRQCWRAEAGR